MAVTAGRVLAAVEEHAAVRPMARALRPPASVVVTVVISPYWFTAALYGGDERDGLAELAVAGARSLWPLVVMLAALRVDLSLREP